MNLGRRSRTAIIFVGLEICFVALITRLFLIQILHGEELRERGERERRTQVQSKVRRGKILDRHRNVFAINQDLVSVYADPKAMKVEPYAMADKLAPVLNVPRPQLLSALQEKNRHFVWLQRKLDYDTLTGIRQVTKGVRGLGYEIHGKRGYPKDNLACHIIGYTNYDDTGVEGIEYQYNDYLSQAREIPPPQNSTEVSPQGGYPTVVNTGGTKPLAAPPEPSQDTPEYGHSIVLTIDEYIQYIAEKELIAACEDLQAPAGSAIVMHSKSGEILAMANYPNYNLNRYSQSEESAKRNLAIWMQYEPGSVFKIVSASAALNEKVMTPDSRVYCEGGAYRLPNGHVIHDVRPNGWLTLTGVIQKSSNIGIVKVATRLGKEGLDEYVRRFGFGAKTGVDLPYEQPGNLRGLRYGYSLGQVPFGQGISVTPIQMLNAMNVIAAGGVLLQPYIVQEILDGNGKVLKQSTPTVIRRVISPEAAEEIKKMLVLVTEAGSGRRARVQGYQVAGKTGTAQKAEKGKGYVKGKVINTFVGFLPADEPQISILVVLDEPAGGPLSGLVAAPLFQKIAEQTMRYLNQKDIFVHSDVDYSACSSD